MSRRATTFYNDWHHIAISVQNSGKNLELKFHVDGAVVETRTALGQAVAVLPAPHVANIGALRTGHEIEQMVDNQWLSVVAEWTDANCIGGWQRGDHTVTVTITPNAAWPFVSGTHRDITTGPLADDGVSFRRALDENAVHYTLRVLAKELEELPWVPIAERALICRLDDIGHGSAFNHPAGPWAAGPYPDPVSPEDTAENWYELLSRAQGLRKYTGDVAGVDLGNGNFTPGVYRGIRTWENPDVEWLSGPVPESLVVTFDQSNNGPQCSEGSLRTFPNGQIKFLVEVRNPLGVILGTVESNVVQPTCVQP